MPGEIIQDDGPAPVYTRPGCTKYATVGGVAAEHKMEQAAVVRGRAAASAAAVDRWLAARTEMQLSADQAAALKGLMTSGAAVSALVGPAGCGKTFVLGGL